MFPNLHSMLSLPPYSLCSPSSCHKCLELPPCASRVAPTQGQFPLTGEGRCWPKGSWLHAALPRTEPAVPCASCLDGPPDCEVLVRCFFFFFLSSFQLTGGCLPFVKHSTLLSFLKCLENESCPSRGLTSLGWSTGPRVHSIFRF